MKDIQRFYNILLGSLVVIILIATAIRLYSMFSDLLVTVREADTGPAFANGRRAQQHIFRDKKSPDNDKNARQFWFLWRF